MENCIILTTDEIDLVSTLENYKNFDYIVCERGALYSVYNVLNVVKVIGDLDSLNKYDKNRILLCYPNISVASTKKSTTDGELAIMYAIEKKYKNIYMFVSGDRYDHGANHLFILNKYNKHNIYIFDKYNWAFSLKKGENFINQNALYVSFFAFSKDILTSKNLLYPLNNALITFKNTNFISNEIKNSEKLTSVFSKSGNAICIIHVKTPGTNN